MGSWVGESELSHWLEVVSESLPTFDVFVHTYFVCVYCYWKEKTWLWREVEHRGNEKALGLHIAVWGRGQGGQADNRVGDESPSVSFCCRGGPAPFLGLDRLVGSLSMRKAFQNPKPTPLLSTHSRSHFLTWGTLLQLRVPRDLVFLPSVVTYTGQGVSPFSLSRYPGDESLSSPISSFYPAAQGAETSLGWGRQGVPGKSPHAAPEETGRVHLGTSPRASYTVVMENKQVFSCWFFLHQISTEKNGLWRGNQLCHLCQVHLCVWAWQSLLGPP